MATKYQFCDKDTGKIYSATEKEVREWITKNYKEDEFWKSIQDFTGIEKLPRPCQDMMLDSINNHPGSWFNGMFRDCRKVIE